MSAAAAVGPPVAAERDRLAVLYDRDCGLCTATARQLDRWDRRHSLRLVPLQEVDRGTMPEIAALVRGRPLAAALHVVDPKTGAVRSGGDAALAVAGRLPGGRIADAVGRIPPARWAVGIGYDVVASHRHRIGRWLRLEGPDCDVPR
jgi:predicted DCC family thiol-disulfide oxidoreductase YuxK